MAPETSQPSSSPLVAERLLTRPAEQRTREFKYRFAQGFVFGLPVLALQWFGHALGGSPDEAARWTAVLQALLAGWVTYVAGASLVAEGILRYQRGLPAAGCDFWIATAAVLVYLYSLASTLGVFMQGRPFYSPLFHVAVATLSIWTGARWLYLARCSGSIRSI